MKHIFYSVLFLVTFLSCRNTTSAHLTEEKEPVAASNKADDKSVYHEVTDISRHPDYNSVKRVQKLDLDYQALSLKIRYISERAYITISNKNNNQADWQPLKINFYYDMSFADAEKDIHLLLKGNSTDDGYLLLPAFTEQYPSYFLYYFKENTLDYLGNYEATDFNKGAFSFNGKSKELYRAPDSKLSKADEVDRAGFDPVAGDLELLKEHSDTPLKNQNNADVDKSKAATINKQWFGTYNGSFLRLKGESADPRAWGKINVIIRSESVKFNLDSYNENVAKELKIVFADAQKIRFVARDNDKQVLTLILDKNNYRLSGTLLEQIVGLRETYELQKD